MKTFTKRLLCLLLSMVMLLTLVISTASCAAEAKVMMTLGNHSMTENQFLFLLSRAKAAYEHSGFTVKDWDTYIDLNGTTYDIYVRQQVLQEAKLMLAKSGNPQLAEFILDRAYFDEMSAIANKQGSAFLQGYVKVMIDSANLRTAVRTVRMNKGIDFLMQALIAGGNVSPAKMAQAAVSGDGLAALFTATVLQNAAAAGVEAMKGGSMTKFELACDNAVTAYLGGAKMVSFGCQPVIKYLALVEAETTAVRMILSGKMAGIAPHVIRERLREIDA